MGMVIGNWKFADEKYSPGKVGAFSFIYFALEKFSLWMHSKLKVALR